MPDVLSVVLRALTFVLLFQAAGIAIFVAVFGRFLTNALRGIRRVGQVSALVGMILAIAHQAMEASRMAGEMSGIFDTSLQATALVSSGGAAFGLRMLGLLLIALGLRRATDRPVALVGAAVAIISFTLIGHTSTHAHRWALAALLAVHLLVVAFWFGALWPLYHVSSREPREIAARVIDAFSVAASWLVPSILAAGLALTAFLVPHLEVFEHPYGQLLMAKLAIFAVLMFLAALNKWRLGPAIARGDPRAPSGFRNSVLAEYILVCGVLAVTAVMTSLFSPE